MNAETQSCVSASLMYMTYDEHTSYGKYLYSKSVIINNIGQGYYRKQITPTHMTYWTPYIASTLLTWPFFLRHNIVIYSVNKHNIY